ncbi:hypothetical protein BGZ68_007680 [Mortierella alpina]|nr:hypothetical protein BGZ68_007680 [Mortierella alpina]
MTRKVTTSLMQFLFPQGGRYDAVSEDFNSENWQFHVLMMIYFFFTVILMLNVLIALINVAFSDGDETWSRVWTFNRLHVIESAENLSYQIPGYRQSSPWFPKVIYYSATKKQVREFKEKYLLDDNQDLGEAGKSIESDPEHLLTSLQTRRSALEREMKDMRDQSQNWYEKLQGQSINLKLQNDALKVQVEALQTAFDAQTRDLKAILEGVNQLLPTSS